MQNQNVKQQECAGGVCEKKGNYQTTGVCAGGVCDKTGQKQQELQEENLQENQRIPSTNITEGQGKGQQQFQGQGLQQNQEKVVPNLKQGENIPQSNTLGQDMKGIAIAQQQHQKIDEKYLPSNTSKPGVDYEKSAPGKW